MQILDDLLPSNGGHELYVDGLELTPDERWTRFGSVMGEGDFYPMLHRPVSSVAMTALCLS